jgi:hypothetical protein
VVAERGVSRPALVQQLRNAVEELAIDYEDIAYAGVVQTPEERVRTALARKRGKPYSTDKPPGTSWSVRAIGGKVVRPYHRDASTLVLRL